jgi:hypothetical protein
VLGRWARVGQGQSCWEVVFWHRTPPSQPPELPMSSSFIWETHTVDFPPVPYNALPTAELVRLIGAHVSASSTHDVVLSAWGFSGGWLVSSWSSWLLVRLSRLSRSLSRRSFIRPALASPTYSHVERRSVAAPVPMSEDDTQRSVPVTELSRT